MRPFLLLFVILRVLDTSGQSSQTKMGNNVLTFKYADGTPIPDGGQRSFLFSQADSSPLEILINHRATLKYLFWVKKTCKRMGLYLNYRALLFDERQQLVGIELDYAVKKGNVATAFASALTDSTRFGVFAYVTPDSYRYYIGYEHH